MWMSRPAFLRRALTQDRRRLLIDFEGGNLCKVTYYELSQQF
jgi:hypothetical protein